MSKKKQRGPCFRCGASLYLANCEPPYLDRPCPDCGQCHCLRHYEEDYKPETDWTK